MVSYPGAFTRILREFADEHDQKRSLTVHIASDLMNVLDAVRGDFVGNTMLDIGCGFGGLAAAIAMYLGLEVVHGVDIDSQVTLSAAAKGVRVKLWDIAHVPLPYDTSSFDLITSFGVLDYLNCFDEILQDIYRLLRPGGHAIISLPNLAAWHNRVLLLLGYQVRDVEVSRLALVGCHPYYKAQDKPVGHAHTVTTGGFRELMERVGFVTKLVRGGRPRNREQNPVISALDSLLCRWPSLARRFLYVGRKPCRCAIMPDHLSPRSDVVETVRGVMAAWCGVRGKS